MKQAMWLSNYTINGYKNKLVHSEGNRGIKTRLRAKLLQTPKVSGVLLEADPKQRCQACRQHGPEADCAHLNLIKEKTAEIRKSEHMEPQKVILLKSTCVKRTKARLRAHMTRRGLPDCAQSHQAVTQAPRRVEHNLLIRYSITRTQQITFTEFDPELKLTSGPCSERLQVQPLHAYAQLRAVQPEKQLKFYMKHGHSIFPIFSCAQ